MWASTMKMDKKIWGLLAAGQLVSLCLVGTSACSAVLARRGFDAPMMQSFLNYALICVVFGGMVVIERWRHPVLPTRDNQNTENASKKRLSLSLVAIFISFAVSDVEANFLIVQAYQYTSMLSITVLDCFTIPTVTLLSILFLGTRYSYLHLFGVMLSIFGLILLVFTDLSSSEGAPEPGGEGSRALGDSLTLVAAVLYGISNILQEALTLQLDWRKVLACLGLIATIVSGIQCVALEHDKIAEFSFEQWDIVLIVGYVLCLFCIYAVVPQILMASGATFLNLSLLTSDFWAVLFGVTVLKEKLQWTYFVAFTATLVGLITYHAKGVPDHKSNVVCAGPGAGTTTEQAAARHAAKNATFLSAKWPNRIPKHADYAAKDYAAKDYAAKKIQKDYMACHVGIENYMTSH